MLYFQDSNSNKVYAEATERSLMDRLPRRLPLLLTLPTSSHFTTFRASRLAILFTLILLMTAFGSDKHFGLVARPVVAGRAEGTENCHPTIHDTVLCHKEQRHG